MPQHGTSKLYLIKWLGSAYSFVYLCTMNNFFCVGLPLGFHMSKVNPVMTFISKLDDLKNLLD